jgi:hypothetical protein
MSPCPNPVVFILSTAWYSEDLNVSRLLHREMRKMSFATSLLRGVGASAEPHLLTWFSKLR